MRAKEKTKRASGRTLLRNRDPVYPKTMCDNETKVCSIELLTEGEFVGIDPLWRERVHREKEHLSSSLTPLMRTGEKV